MQPSSSNEAFAAIRSRSAENRCQVAKDARKKDASIGQKVGLVLGLTHALAQEPAIAVDEARVQLRLEASFVPGEHRALHPLDELVDTGQAVDVDLCPDVSIGIAQASQEQGIFFELEHGRYPVRSGQRRRERFPVGELARGQLRKMSVVRGHLHGDLPARREPRRHALEQSRDDRRPSAAPHSRTPDRTLDPL